LIVSGAAALFARSEDQCRAASGTRLRCVLRLADRPSHSSAAWGQDGARPESVREQDERAGRCRDLAYIVGQQPLTVRARASPAVNGQPYHEQEQREADGKEDGRDRVAWRIALGPVPAAAEFRAHD
jgi:hypothetical protein